MARRSQFQGSRAPAPRRYTSWLTGPQLDLTALTAVGNTIFTSGVQILEDGITLVRTRGEMLLRTSAVGDVAAEMSGAVGIAVASENAFGAGSSSLMEPFGDSEWDGWIWHSFFRVGGLINDGSGVQRIVIDSKAMRKIKALDIVYGAMRVEVESGIVTMQVAADTRMLFKLS